MQDESLPVKADRYRGPGILPGAKWSDMISRLNPYTRLSSGCLSLRGFAQFGDKHRERFVSGAVEAVAAEIWPELRANPAARVPVIPTQSGGYTDSRWLRRAGIATYGVSGLFSEEGKTGVHGLNEQVEVARLMPGAAPEATRQQAERESAAITGLCVCE